MDQTFLTSAIGNIIKSELLYRAGVSPHEKVGSLKNEEWLKLFQSARVISKQVLRSCKGLLFCDAFDLSKKESFAGHSVETYKGEDGRTMFWIPAVQI